MSAMSPTMQQKETTAPTPGETADCTACHRTLSLADLAHLHDLETGRQDGQGEVLLCDRCLETRRSRSWYAPAAKTGRLADAMGGRHDRTHSRFSYLQDEEKNIHLIRLRPQWVDDHMRPQHLSGH